MGEPEGDGHPVNGRPVERVYQERCTLHFRASMDSEATKRQINEMGRAEGDPKGERRGWRE